MLISPACRFGVKNAPVIGGDFFVAGQGRGGSEGAVVEKGAVDPVTEAEAEFRAVLQSVVGGGDAAVVGNAVVVCVGTKEEGPFGIPHEVLVAVTGSLGLNAAVVVFVGPVAVAAIPVGDEVIGIVGRITPDGEAGITCAVGVKPAGF